MDNQFQTQARNFLTSTMDKESKARFIELVKMEKRGREDIIYFSEEMLGVPLNDYQKKWLTRTTTPRNKWKEVFDDNIEDIGGYLFGSNISSVGNQSGKTVSIAIKHIWFNRYKIGMELDKKLINTAYYSTLNISPHSRQTRACYGHVEDILGGKFIINEEGKKRLNNLSPLMKDFLVGSNINLGEIRFSNKSIFYSCPTGADQASSLAGAQFGFISYDECHSQDTEVLTSQGWKKFIDVKIGDTVPSLNLETGLVEDAKVRAVIDKKYKGKMVQFGGGGHRFDMLVTPGHKMVASTVGSSRLKYRYKPFIFHEAKELLVKEHRINQIFEYQNDAPNPKTIIIKGYSKKPLVGRPFRCEDIEVPAKAYFEFFGLFITEGSVNKNTVVISQTSKGNAYKRIPEVLNALGFKWKQNKAGFYICNSQLARHLENETPKYSYYKRIPRWMLESHKEILLSLFNGIVLGDGWMKSNGRCGYVGTVSEGLADDYMELFLKLGMVPSSKIIPKDKEGGWVNGQRITSRREFYVVNFRKDFRTPKCGLGRNERFADAKEVDYDGRVYCLNLDKNNTLLVRRNGKIAWSGNCSQSLHLREELGAKILSRLIKYGCCLDLIATPEVDSPSHQYYLHIVRMGMKGVDGWWSLTGMGMDDNKFISKEQRERAKATLLATDKKRYRQVVLGEFITSGKRFFDSSEIENMWKLTNKQDCVRNGKYLLVADWGFSDSGDESVFMVLDYTNFHSNGKILLVNHESIKGGSPQMQFSLLRTLYDQYTWYDDDGVTAHFPTFLTDAQGLGGVVIKKLLVLLKPKSFDIDKDEALFITKNAMAKGRDYVESDVDGAIIERNPNYGIIRSYYIDELNEQLSSYHIEDKKLTTDYTMTLMMGISYIIKKFGSVPSKKINLNPLAGYNASMSAVNRSNYNSKNISLIR